MLDVERDAGPGTSTLALGVVPHHVDAVWIVVSEVQHVPTVPASCRPGVGAIFGGCYVDGAFARAAELRQCASKRQPRA